MSVEISEARLEAIEALIKEQAETIKKQQHELERVAAFNECMNLMNKYEYYLPTKQNDKVLDLFALKTPGVRTEIANWGVWDGPEAVTTCYLKVHDNFAQTPGSLVILTNTTQVFEVAEDGMTAKAIWICPGLETMAPPDGSKPQAHWSWAKRACDFVKEDGVWKIWHYHVYGILCTPYEVSWVDAPPAFWDDASAELPEDEKPTRPPTHPLWMYSVDKVPECVPAPPLPYATFDEKDAF